MNKTTSTHILSVLLSSITTFRPANCGTDAPLKITPTPLQSPTAVPPYIHYALSQRFNIHLNFDYPGTWILGEEKREADWMVVGLWDPRFLTLPTPFPPDFHPTPSDFGNVNIFIFPRESGQTPDTEVEFLKQSYSETSWMTVLNDYKITIDGYDTSVLEYQIKPSESYLSLMFERRILFVVED